MKPTTTLPAGLARGVFLSATLAALSACGGGGGGTSPSGNNPPPGTTTYTVGGSVSGLVGSGLVLTNAGASLPVSANGTFVFAASVASGAAYSVAVQTNPASPNQTCTVANASGTASANVTNVAVACATNTYTVGGSVSGLSGSITLRQTSGGATQDVTVSGSTFTFPALASGSSYAVSLVGHPTGPSQTCSIQQGTGTVGAANVTNVAVSCSTNAYTVGGAVTNYKSPFALRVTSGSTVNDITVSGGTFTFPSLPSGSAYTVSLQAQPTAPAQTCSVTAGASGTVTTADVTSVAVGCVNNDTSIPTLTAKLPLDTTVGTNLLTTIVADFSEALAPATVTTSTFTVSGPQGAVAGAVALSNGNQRVTFTPSAALLFDANYVVTATTGVEDAGGNGLAADVTWRFNTGHKLVGGYHTCARLDGANNGKVKCWGANQYGQLGRANTAPVGNGSGNPSVSASSTLDLGAGRTAVEIEAGTNHTCVRLDNGQVKCWGLNDFGQLGYNSNINLSDEAGELPSQLPPVPLGAGRTALQLALGVSTTCARLDDGTVKCWGSNESGVPAQGTTYGAVSYYPTPQTVNLGTNLFAESIEGSNGYHFCAILRAPGAATTSVKCWGENAYGQLGLGDNGLRGDSSAEMGNALAALTLGAGRQAQQVTASSGHTCALLDDSSVRCWGNNWFGQLATGVAYGMSCGSSLSRPARASATTAVKWPASPSTLGANVAGGIVPVELVSGDRQLCARFSSGRLKCWGWNGLGQLGYGDTNTRGDSANEMGANLPFVDLGSNTGVPFGSLEVTAGAFHFCSLLDNGSAGVKCWGYNDTQVGGSPSSGQGGQLGSGNTTARGASPSDMGNGLGFVIIGN